MTNTIQEYTIFYTEQIVKLLTNLTPKSRINLLREHVFFVVENFENLAHKSRTKCYHKQTIDNLTNTLRFFFTQTWFLEF